MPAGQKLFSAGKAAFIKAITLDTEEVFDSLLVGSAGDVEIIPIHNTAAVTITLEAGWHPIVFKQINTAGTTATGLFGGREGKPS